MAKDFKISKPNGVCHATGRDIAPGEEFVALLRMDGEELVREDYHLDSWTEQQEQAAVANSSEEPGSTAPQRDH